MGFILILLFIWILLLFFFTAFINEGGIELFYYRRIPIDSCLNSTKKHIAESNRKGDWLPSFYLEESQCRLVF